MGQINTNNYPTVSSLADADLLIVENAIHGTGTTTPKQLRENAIGTDTLETTAQTVTGAINELKNEMTSAGHTLAGVGHKTAYDSASYTIDSDIILHRAPKGMDRVLLFLDERITRPLNLTIYGESYSDEYTIPLSINSSVGEPPAYMDGICILEYHEFEEDFALIARYEAVTGSNGVVPISKGGTGNSYGYIRTGRATGSNVGYGATIEGVDNTASNSYAHAGGQSVVAEGLHSFAHGLGANAGSAQQTAFGRYNDNKAANLFEVGNGTADNARSNALEVTADGHVLDGNGNDLQSVAALEQSASGNPIIVNAQGIDAKELSVEIEPIQDLHGYDKPWVGGSGKNKLPQTVASVKAANTDGTWTGNVYTINNGTVEVLTDNASNIISYKVNGTFNDATVFKVGVPTGGNILNGCPSGGSWESYLMYQSNGAVDTGSGGSGVITTANVVISIASGYNASNLIFRPMTRATDASADFEQWENICPISGRTETSVVDHGKNYLPMTTANIKAINTEGTWSGNTYTYKGVDYTIHEDSAGHITKFHAQGTASGGNSLLTLVSDVYLANKYIGMLMSGCSGGSQNTYFLSAAYSSNGTSWARETDIYDGESAILNYPFVRFLLFVKNGGSVNTDFYPMVRPSGTSADFEPYKSSSVTIQLGQTVYGGTLNVTTGVLTVDRKYYTLTADGAEDTSAPNNIVRIALPIPSDSITWTSTSTKTGKLLCDMFEESTNNDTYTGAVGILYRINGTHNLVVGFGANFPNVSSFNDAKTWITNNAPHIVYRLAEPVTIQLTPTQLTMLKGYNYITADGEMSMVYIPESVLPTAPTTDGNYKLRCTVTNGQPSFSWVSDT